MSYRSTEEWVEIRKGGDYVNLGERFAVSPVIARLLRNRGADSDDEIRSFLYGTLQDLEDPRLLNGSVAAVRLLHHCCADHDLGVRKGHGERVPARRHLRQPAAIHP